VSPLAVTWTKTFVKVDPPMVPDAKPDSV